MTQSSTTKNEVPLEASIPEGGASLESILCTEELQNRPSRTPDCEKENRALVKLVSALADSPGTVLQTLAETILDITQCDSAGLSLLTKDGKTPDVCGSRFYWPAIAGMWKPHIGKGTPRNFGPCGDVLDQNRTLLFKHFERRYPYFEPVIPLIEECLLVPFYVAGEAVGTIWAIMHSQRRKFDAEDDRVMASLGKFASSAYQSLVHIDDLKIQIAEREKAEAEVRELARGLEAKIRRLVEANVVGIVMWNLEGAITGANDAFLRMVQYDREDLTSGRVRWTELTPAEWRERDGQAIADLRATGIVQPFEKEYFRKDGSRVSVLLGGALFEGSGNEGVAFVLDLTEQKRMQEKLRESETLLQAFLGNTPNLVFLKDRQGRYLYINRAFTRAFPITGEQIVGKTDDELFSAEQAAAFQTNDRQVLLAGFPMEFEELFPQQDGQHIGIVQKFPLFNAEGEIYAIGGVVTDITERRREESARRYSEQKLRQAQADLAHMNRVSTMGELTASLAHEIKQPIAAAVTDAKTCLRWLAHDQPDMTEARESVSRCIKDVTRASDIIRRIGSLFKKDDLRRELLDVNEVIQEMINLLRSEAIKHSISICTDLAEALPPVMADRVQLQQVFMNLMLNGIDAMKDLNTHGTLRIKSQQNKGEVLVLITDTGVGLRPEQTDQIFSAFVTSKSQGIGMGLPISRSIIESHGGRLWATCNSGSGATFQFTLPLEATARLTA